MRGILATRDESVGRLRRNGLVLAGFIAFSFLVVLAASRVHVNASWSDGAWGYAVLPLWGDPAIGDRVLFEPPEDLRSSVPWLKTVRGLPGMVVTVDEDRMVKVGGDGIGSAKTHALDGRSLDAAESSTIPPGHYYLHGDHPDSHDSRYAEVGPVPRERILGRALALPDIRWLGLEGPLVGPEDVRADQVAGR